MNSELEAHRDFYARFIVASAGSSNERLISAFAHVPRERFLGEGPWPIWTGNGYLPTISNDPRHIYCDVVVGLIPAKGINNGQPALHAKCLSALDPAPSETVVHVGAGTGYYTAVLAHLVGPAGSVQAYEVEESLASRACVALRDFTTVNVHCRNASDGALPRADIVYVNAGVTTLPDPWLDALNLGGRLIAPLTPNEGYGGMLMVTRVSDDAFAAQILGRVAFVPCAGHRSDFESAALAAAFEPNSFRAVRSLRRRAQPDNSAWYVGSNWWLSTEQPPPIH